MRGQCGDAADGARPAGTRIGVGQTAVGEVPVQVVEAEQAEVDVPVG